MSFRLFQVTINMLVIEFFLFPFNPFPRRSDCRLIENGTNPILIALVDFVCFKRSKPKVLRSESKFMVGHFDRNAGAGNGKTSLIDDQEGLLVGPIFLNVPVDPFQKIRVAPNLDDLAV